MATTWQQAFHFCLIYSFCLQLKFVEHWRYHCLLKKCMFSTNLSGFYQPNSPISPNSHQPSTTKQTNSQTVKQPNSQTAKQPKKPKQPSAQTTQTAQTTLKELWDFFFEKLGVQANTFNSRKLCLHHFKFLKFGDISFKLLYDDSWWPPWFLSKNVQKVQF